jgi:hypothetical protein
MALGLDGDALDRSCYAGGFERIPEIESPQAASRAPQSALATPSQAHFK